jgi:flagellin
LFDGSAAFTANIQVGADNAVSDSTNRVALGASLFIDARTQTLGTTGATAISTTLTIGADETGVTNNDVTINGTSIGAVGTGTNGSYAANIAQAITNADPDVAVTVGTSTFATGVFTAITQGTSGSYSLDINGVDIFSADTSSITTTEMEDAINSKQSELAALGITVSGDSSNGFTFTRTDGGNINLNEVAGTAAIASGGFQNALSNSDSTNAVTHAGYGTLTLSSAFDIVIGGNDTTTIGQASAATITSNAGTGTALNGIDLQDETNSQTALTSIDSALNTVNLARSNLGANYSRLDSVSNSLASTVENYTAARSRVQDADFAVESANLARTQVLQQAGISVLAQANALPQQVLALLQ